MDVKEVKKIGYRKCIEMLGEGLFRKYPGRWIFVTSEDRDSIHCWLGLCPPDVDPAEELIAPDMFECCVYCCVDRTTGTVKDLKKADPNGIVCHGGFNHDGDQSICKSQQERENVY